MVMSEKKKFRVLVAEDTYETRELLKLMFRELEDIAEFVYCDDGDCALELYLNEQNFDLLLLDVSMPTMTGLRVAEKIRFEHHDDKTVIKFVTAHDHQELSTRALTETRASLAGGEIIAKERINELVAAEHVWQSKPDLLDLRRLVRRELERLRT